MKRGPVVECSDRPRNPLPSRAGPAAPFKATMVRILGFFAIFLVLSFPLPAMAARNAAPTDRPPDQGGYTRAMGIPSLFKNTVGLEYLSYHTTSDHALGALVTAGTTRYIGSPVVGILGLGLEGYLGGHASETDAGGRAYLTIPSLLIGAGVDYSATSHESDLVLKLDVPARRKGIIGSGSAVTLRWLPHREQTFAVGLNIPIGDRNAGRTRPQSDYVKMDNREPARLQAEKMGAVDSTFVASLRSLRVRAAWVARLTQPFSEYGGADATRAMAPRIAELRAEVESLLSSLASASSRTTGMSRSVPRRSEPSRVSTAGSRTSARRAGKPSCGRWRSRRWT